MLNGCPIRPGRKLGLLGPDRRHVILRGFAIWGGAEK